MSDKNDCRQCLSDGDRERILLDVPPAMLVPHTDYIPSGYGAMEHIYLEGDDGRRSDRIAWWIPVTGWFVVGIVIFGAVMPALPLITVLEALLFAVVVLTPLVLLWNGVTDKISVTGNQD